MPETAVAQSRVAYHLVKDEKYGPMIVLNPDAPSYHKKFQFGPGKARLILDNLDKIRQFLSDHG